MKLKKGADKLALSSDLFTLRMWSEDLGDGRLEWRGKVQHIASGESRYFRDWQTLEAFVEGVMLVTPGAPQSPG